MFAVAFVMSGLTSAFAHLNDNLTALATGGLALAFILSVFLEGQRAK